MKPKLLRAEWPESVRFEITGTSWVLMDGTLKIARGTTTADRRSLIVSRETLASLLKAVNDMRKQRGY